MSVCTHGGLEGRQVCTNILEGIISMAAYLTTTSKRNYTYRNSAKYCSIPSVIHKENKPMKGFSILALNIILPIYAEEVGNYSMVTDTLNEFLIVS